MRTDVSHAAFDPEATQRRRAEAARKREREDEAQRKRAATDASGLGRCGRPWRRPVAGNAAGRAPRAVDGGGLHRPPGLEPGGLLPQDRPEAGATGTLAARAGPGVRRRRDALAALGLQIYVAATTSLVAVYTTLVESRQFETSVTFYNQAAADLGSIRAWWNASRCRSRRLKTIDRLVDRAERVMRAEHIGWVQEMQDAMTQFRMEDSARTASLSGTGKQPNRRPRQTRRNPAQRSRSGRCLRGADA